MEDANEDEVFLNDEQDDIFEKPIGTNEGDDVYVAINSLVLDDNDILKKT